MKSVSNWISYLHQFSQIFSHLVSIFLVRRRNFRVFLIFEIRRHVGPHVSGKPPRAAPGLAAQGGTAVAPRHKGAPCPTGPVSARLCPKPPRPAVRARPSAAPLPAPPHAHLRLLRASSSPATADCRPLPRPPLDHHLLRAAPRLCRRASPR
jgi:hypothetical protein